MAHVLICFAKNSMCSHGLCLYSIGAMSWIRNRTNLVFGCTCGRFLPAARKRSLGRPGWKVKMSHSRIAIIQHIKLQQMGGFQIWETPPHFNGNWRMKWRRKFKAGAWSFRDCQDPSKGPWESSWPWSTDHVWSFKIKTNQHFEKLELSKCYMSIMPDLCAMQATHVNSWLPNFLRSPDQKQSSQAKGATLKMLRMCPAGSPISGCRMSQVSWRCIGMRLEDIGSLLSLLGLFQPFGPRSC